MFDRPLFRLVRAAVSLVTFALVFSVALPSAHAGKIGYVDVKKALLLTKDGLEAKKRLAQMKARYQEQLNGLQQRLKEKKAYYDMHRSTLKKEEVQKLQTDMQRMFLQLQQAYAGLTKQLMQVEATETNKIVKKMLPILEKIRAKHGLDMIVDRSRAQILVARQEIDYTRQLVCKYNQAHGGDTSYCKKKGLPKTPEIPTTTDKPEDPLGVGF